MKLTSHLFRLLASMLMLLGFATTASAQRADDGYRIQQAYYGTARNHVDVTDRLKQLARDDVRFRLGNDSFGVDPAPGQVKTLRIYARNRDRQTRTFEYVEGSVVDGARFDGWQRGEWSRSEWTGGWGGTPNYSAAAAPNRSERGERGGRGDQGEYQILQARYGTARDNVDVTDRLRELARQDRNFRMGNDSFGVDPSPGQRKVLRIFARTPNGQTQTFEYAEGSIVDGAQFSAWAGGNWSRGGNHDGGWGGTPYYQAPVGDRNPPSRNADQGEYQILQARYGTARNNVDVTDRLRELARQDRNFRMGNDSFGVDPSPGQRKVLRIFARTPNGQTQTFEYAEGSVVDGAQFGGWAGGNWSRRGNYDGGWGGTPHYSAPVADRNPPGRNADQGEFQILQARYGTARNNVDVTDRLREQARRDRTLRVTNESFGVDPAPGERKQLRIFARGANGQTRTFEITEGGTVDGAQFAGWSGGNWGRGGHDGSWGSVGAAAPVDVPGNVPAGRPVGRDVPAGAVSRDGRLVIHRAIYGAGSQSADVTARVRENLYQHDTLQMKVANEDLGTDPAPGRQKTLTITYTVDGGRQQEIRVLESQIVTLP